MGQVRGILDGVGRRLRWGESDWVVSTDGLGCEEGSWENVDF